MEQNASKLRSKFAVEVQNVVFSYKKNLKILNNISVQIPEGMFILKIYFLFIEMFMLKMNKKIDLCQRFC